MLHPISLVEGGPIWMDLGTHDIDGAIAFYSAVFGWEFTDTGEDFGHYRMISSGGAAIGGAMSTMVSPDGPLEMPHSPTAWGIYLNTPDIVSTTEQTTEAGGTVVFPPMHVGDLGQMALVTDTAGAMIGFWQPNSFAGIADTSAPGLPVWFECLTHDFDAALAFYRDVAKWNIAWMQPTESPEDVPAYADREPQDGGMRYAVHVTDAGHVAGLCEAVAWLPAGTPSFWRVYIGVSDTDATIASILEAGGSLLDGPIDSPFGRVASVADPQGASFQIVAVPAQNDES